MHHASAQRALPDRITRPCAGLRAAVFHASPPAPPAPPAPPGPQGEPCGRHVVRVMLGPQEWMLFAPLSSGATAAAMEPLAASLASRHHPSAASATGLLVRVPVLDAGAGAAVLHAAGGDTAIYSPARHLAPAAAARISILAAHAGVTAHGEVTVTRAPHADMLRGLLHPAAALGTAGACRIVVCGGLVSAEAAEAIGLLCTAQAGYQNAA
jgi:hypothetical protein